jgi:membrane associated rhomboid family serine protease
MNVHYNPAASALKEFFLTPSTVIGLTPRIAPEPVAFGAPLGHNGAGARNRPLHGRPHHGGAKLAKRRITFHGLRARRAFADGVTLLGLVNAGVGLLLEWGQVNDFPVSGITIITMILSEGTESILFGARTWGGGFLLITLPLAVTLPAMIFLAEKIKPAGRLTPSVYLLAGSWGAAYLLYSAVVSKALMGYHGQGFGVCLLGFTLAAVGGMLRWPDSSRECDRIFLEGQQSARPRPGPAAALSPREILASLAVPPPIVACPVPSRMALGALPPATLIIVGLNLAAFFILNFRDDFFWHIVPALAFNAADFQIHTLLTSQFLHFGAVHLIVNMFVLFIIGNEVERAFGWPLFAAFYVVGGALANLVLTMAFIGTSILSAGASGSIAALLGLMLVTMPGRRIRIWFFQIVKHRTVEFRAGWILSLYLVFQTVMAMLQSSGAIESATGYWNHLGGMFYGMAAALLIRERIRKRLTPEDQDTHDLVVPFSLAALAVLAGLVDLFRSAA